MKSYSMHSVTHASLVPLSLAVMLMAALVTTAHSQAAHPHNDQLVAALVPLIPQTEFAITARRLDEVAVAPSVADQHVSAFSSSGPSFHAASIADTLRSVGALSHEEHVSAVGPSHIAEASLLDTVLANDHLYDSFHSPMVLVHDASDHRDYFSGPSDKLFSVGDGAGFGEEEAVDAERWESMVMELEEGDQEW
ncbi:hypothetical protein BCR44DRAFT_1517408 [Catenaria anguillulae PL171]|uniref:Uncharacterized protein n=1 Tax=Catenaria anguillulae PL171 TaxID=765915 RepID=A0A1Y2H6N8_9FUNG|nr:hypothetical protein BCR44DRAFT_1517408 [Catenaria anguillulae PL171]